MITTALLMFMLVPLNFSGVGESTPVVTFEFVQDTPLLEQNGTLETFNTITGSKPPLDDITVLREEISIRSKTLGLDLDLVNKIIQCESAFKPYAINYNKNGTIDYGYWQINNYWWEEYLLEKGWNIKLPEENLEAGFYLLDTYGTKLWYPSEFCWNK